MSQSPTDDPVAQITAYVRQCLVEERGADAEATYSPMVKQVGGTGDLRISLNPGGVPGPGAMFSPAGLRANQLEPIQRIVQQLLAQVDSKG